MLPINFSGKTVEEYASEGISTGNTLMYASIANLPAGSDLYW